MVKARTLAWIGLGGVAIFVGLVAALAIRHREHNDTSDDLVRGTVAAVNHRDVEALVRLGDVAGVVTRALRCDDGRPALDPREQLGRALTDYDGAHLEVTSHKVLLQLEVHEGDKTDRGCVAKTHVARYWIIVELLADRAPFKRRAMLDAIISDGSWYLLHIELHPDEGSPWPQ